MGIDHDSGGREFTGHQSTRQRRRHATAIAAASLAVAVLIIAATFAANTIGHPLGPKTTATTPDDTWLRLRPGAENLYFWAGAADRNHLYAAFNNCPTAPTPEPTMGSTLSPIPAPVAADPAPAFAAAYPVAEPTTFSSVVPPWTDTVPPADRR